MIEERRALTLAAAGVQVRAAAEEGQPRRFVGRAAVYGVRAPIGDPKTWGFYEEFAPGTFASSIGVDDQRMLIDHDSYYLVSRVSAGDLRLQETDAGVEVDSDLDEEISYVRDLVRHVERRRITGMSIGFRVLEDRWSTVDVEEPQPDGKVRVYTAELRTVLKGQLIEVSAVTWPAFMDTEASLRSLVAPALAVRGDTDAIERRAKLRPDLRALVDAFGQRAARDHREPEPAPAARGIDPALIMRAYQARYPRLRG